MVPDKLSALVLRVLRELVDAAVVDALAIRFCPLLDSARRNPDVVCGLHQGLIDALAPVCMTLSPFAGPGLCLAVPAHV